MKPPSIGSVVFLMKQIILLLIDCISQLKVKKVRVPVFPKVEGGRSDQAAGILNPQSISNWMDGWTFGCLDGWMDV